MRLARALQWGIYDRLLAVGSLVLGLALALGAIWVGTGDWIVTFATGDLGARPSGDGVAITAIGLLAGLFVWQVGATAARYRTLVGATRRELRGVSADAGGDLEERIGQLESDVEEVRRVAARIEQGMRTGEFDAAGLDGDSSAGSGRAAGEAANSSTGDAAGSATGDAGARSPSGSAAVATGSSDAKAADDADATADGGRAGTDQADGVKFSGDGSQSADDADGAAAGTGADQDAASSTDGGTTADAAAADAGAGAGDDATADGTADGAAAKEEDAFEWPEEGDDGEYYRNS